MFDQAHILFDDGRGKYPDRVTAQVPRGFREQAKRAAKRQGVTLGEFVRRALSHAVVEASAAGCLPGEG